VSRDGERRTTSAADVKNNCNDQTTLWPSPRLFPPQQMTMTRARARALGRYMYTTHVRARARAYFVYKNSSYIRTDGATAARERSGTYYYYMAKTIVNQKLLRNINVGSVRSRKAVKTFILSS